MKSPITEAREQSRALGDDRYEFRVHLVVNDHVEETVFVCADGFDEAEKRAAAFHVAEKVTSAAEVEGVSFLVEPIKHCAGDDGNGCPDDNIITRPDPRTARYSDGSPVPFDLDSEVLCVHCGAVKHMGAPR